MSEKTDLLQKLINHRYMLITKLERIKDKAHKLEVVYFEVFQNLKEIEETIESVKEAIANEGKSCDGSSSNSEIKL